MSIRGRLNHPANQRSSLEGATNRNNYFVYLKDIAFFIYILTTINKKDRLESEYIKIKRHEALIRIFNSVVQGSRAAGSRTKGF